MIKFYSFLKTNFYFKVFVIKNFGCFRLNLETSQKSVQKRRDDRIKSVYEIRKDPKVKPAFEVNGSCDDDTRILNKNKLMQSSLGPLVELLRQENKNFTISESAGAEVRQEVEKSEADNSEEPNDKHDISDSDEGMTNLFEGDSSLDSSLKKKRKRKRKRKTVHQQEVELEVTKTNYQTPAVQNNSRKKNNKHFYFNQDQVEENIESCKGT